MGEQTISLDQDDENLKFQCLFAQSLRKFADNLIVINCKAGLCIVSVMFRIEYG